MTIEAPDHSRQSRASQAARPKRRRTLVNAIGAGVIIGLLVAIAVVVGRSMASDDGPVVTGKVVVPAHTAAGTFSVGDRDAPVTLDLHYDYMCPACGAFEATNGEDLSRLVSDGTARVRLHVMSFLDEQSGGTEYSTRAANAYAAVADAAPGQVWAFHNALYAHQPHEGSQGLSDAQIAAIATDVGVPSRVVETFTDGTYRGWVAQSTQDAFAVGVNSTPLVAINGVVFAGNWAAQGELARAIQAAARGA
jgi:protein-disulfide isomerase